MPKKTPFFCVRRLPPSECGFSLIEVAIVLVLLGLLLGGLSMSLVKQLELRRISDTQKQMEEAREALLAYAVSHKDSNNHGYLPCPDIHVPPDGKEDRISISGLCSKEEGTLPWVTLGLSSGLDAWHHYLRYRVTILSTGPANANSGITLDAATPPTPVVFADIKISTKKGCPTNPAFPEETKAENVPALILSYGADGHGGLNSTGVWIPVNAGDVIGDDEAENFQTRDACFVSRDFNDGSYSPTLHFDDQVVWLSTSQLLNRLIAAGRLP